MNDDCATAREQLAELALGIADGEDRARALDHLSGCAGCRAELERLAAAADETSLLAAPLEPPPGFEARAIAAIHPRQTRRTPWRRLLRPAALGVATALAAAAVVWFALGDDRRLADSYRESLAVANGEYFDAAPLELSGGAKAGYVYGYQGRASWVLAIVYDGVEPGRYRLAVVTRSGERLPVRELVVDAEGRGSSGGVTAAAYEDLGELLILDRRGRQVAEASVGE